MRKTVWLLTVGWLVGRAAAAQQAPAAQLKGSFEEVAGWVVRAAEMVPADKYGFQPAASVRTFGQLIGHVADGQNYYCARGAGDAVDWVQAVEQGSQDKAVLIEKLKASIAVCTAAHAKAGLAGPHHRQLRPHQPALWQRRDLPPPARLGAPLQLTGGVGKTLQATGCCATR